MNLQDKEIKGGKRIVKLSVRIIQNILADDMHNVEAITYDKFGGKTQCTLWLDSNNSILQKVKAKFDDLALFYTQTDYDNNEGFVLSFGSKKFPLTLLQINLGEEIN